LNRCQEGYEEDKKLIQVMTGTYDPIPKAPVDGEGPMWKDIKLDSTRTKYWLGVGAQPSDSAWRLLSMVSVPSSFRECGIGY
jgi:small subunit ribosomal protein S16